MRASDELKFEKTVNMAFRAEDGSLTVQAQSVEGLPKYLGQDFQWCEKVINNYDIQPISFCLLKLTSNISIRDIFSADFPDLRKTLWNDNDSGIILKDEKLYFIEARNRQTYQIVIDEIRAKALISLLNDMQPQAHRFATSQELDLIKETLGTCNIFIDDTISSIEFKAKMEQIKEVYSKLAIIKVNEIVGHGVIAIDDIPANSTITFYSGVLLKETGEIRPVDDCEYSIGNDICIIDSKKFRNISGFISHSFRNINNFFPIQENANKADYSAWRNSILRANLKTENPIIFEHTVYLFFKNPQLIKSGSLLAWDYGVPFWLNKKVMPALLSLEGEIIPPNSYRCEDYDVNKITKGSDEKPIEKSPTVFSISFEAKQSQQKSNQKPEHKKDEQKNSNDGNCQKISFNDELIRCVDEIKASCANLNKPRICDDDVSDPSSIGEWFLTFRLLWILEKIALKRVIYPEVKEHATKYSLAIICTTKEILNSFEDLRYLEEIRKLAIEIIGDFNNADNEDAILALKATTFAFKSELTLDSENCGELKKEYDQLHKQMIKRPKLQKLAAIFEVFFGCILEVIPSLYKIPKAFITNNPYIKNSIFSDGILRWKKSSLSEEFKKTGDAIYSQEMKIKLSRAPG